MIVFINPDEWQQCLIIGKIRLDEKVNLAHARSYEDFEGDKFITAIAHSTAAERIISRFINQPWNGLGTYKDKADVGFDNEIKYTHLPHGHLVTHPADRLFDTAWLVTGENLDYVIRGYIGIMACRQDRYWKAEYDSWWVPQSALWPSSSWHKVMV